MGKAINIVFIFTALIEKYELLKVKKNKEMERMFSETERSVYLL